MTTHTKGLAHRLAPRAPATAHLLLAALLWTAVGGFLAYRGMDALIKLDAAPLVLCLAVIAVLGFGKGMKVMRPAAVKAVARIIERGDGKCVGGFLSWKTWLFVLSMMALGKILRSLGLPPWFVGPLLGSVSLALLIGSQTYWAAYLKKISSRQP